MAAELVRVDPRGTIVGMHPVVGHFATALSPFSAIANILANLGACAVEIKGFKVEVQRLAVQRDIAVRVIQVRQTSIVKLFEAEVERGRSLRLSVEDLRTTNQQITKMFCDPNTPTVEKRIAKEAMGMTITGMRDLHVENRKALVELSSSLNLGDIQTAVTAWRQSS